MSHEIAAVTTCKLCGRKFTGPIIIVGEPPHGRLNRYLQQLAEHIVREHPEVNQGLEIAALHYLGVLRMLNYQSSDTELTGQVDYQRWVTHRQTQAATLSDEALTAGAGTMALSIVDLVYSAIGEPADSHTLKRIRPALLISITDKLTGEFASVRDSLQERGRYQEQTAGTTRNHLSAENGRA
jgi:hypothetical protein